MIHPLVVKSNTVKKELPITLLITSLFAVLLSDNLFDKSMSNNFTRGDGIVLILFFLVFIYYLINLMRNKVEDSTDEKVLSLPKSFLYTFIGLVMIIVGSNFVVDSASYLAKAFGVSERIISLTIIALGTSLPELITSVMATKKGEYDIAIGNAVGSNIFNIGIVIGLPVTILGGISKIAFSYIDLIVMVVTALMLYLFSKNDYKISKREGLSFLILFVVYYSYVILG